MHRRRGRSSRRDQRPDRVEIVAEHLYQAWDWEDHDGDGTPDYLDPDPLPDTDSDGIPDGVEDADHDGDPSNDDTDGDVAGEQRPLRVLVAEDNQEMRLLLVWALEKRGFQVTTAASGEEALERVAACPVDLVIQDIRMPGMGGLKLLETLRAGNPDLPVLVITASDDVLTPT